MLEYTLRQHGLTTADYDRMMAAQDGRCAICHGDVNGIRKLALAHIS
jgi:hypothetical protein